MTGHRRVDDLGRSGDLDPKKVRTIHDLARLAGVSPSTVSRALAGKSVVNAETSQRIIDLAAQHSFRPSSYARNLRIKRRGAIGVIIPLGHERGQHISDPFFMAMIGALADELTERGFDLMLSRVIPDGDDWLERMIALDRVDGFILIGQSDQIGVLEAAADQYLPLVAWGAHNPGQRHCSVGTDNFAGGQIGVQHLIDRGCRRIAFLGNPQAVEIEHRLAGARHAVAQAGGQVMLIDSPTHLVRDLSTDDIGAFLDAQQTLPDGMFAASDVIAQSAIQVLASRGITVPGDIRLVGFDDLPFAATMIPALTTVRQDIAKGAAMLVKSLLERIAGEASGSIVLPPRLIVRATS
ncbi:LacI family DNA-binding transcriptional regulator [Sphingomonas sp. FW199]|uniref:LacI family DNA-binding transcriptional regulator n=1 Tax=Sphingomonas sp. FW199 TaxID=3400217 RepID=UPI003CF3ED26